MNKSSLVRTGLLLMLLIPGIAYGQTSTTTQKNTAMEKNKSMVRDLFEKFVNGRDLSRLQEIIGDDNPGPRGLKGARGFRANLEPLSKAVPDILYKITSLIGEADQVAVSWEWHGTQKAPYNNFGTTDKS